VGMLLACNYPTSVPLNSVTRANKGKDNCSPHSTLLRPWEVLTSSSTVAVY
jgi:hypothetical protein